MGNIFIAKVTKKLLALGSVKRFRASLFLQRVSLTLITKIVLLVISFGLGILIARYLGPEGKGVYAVAVSIAAIGTQFGNFGLHAANTYFITKDKSLLGRIIGNTFWLSLGGGFIITLIVLAILYFNLQLVAGVPFYLIIIASLAIPFSLLSLLGQNILLGMQRIKVFNGFEFGQALVNVIALTILLVLLKQGVFGVIMLSTLMVFFLSIAIFRYLYGIEKRTLNFDFGLFKQMARYGFKAYLAALFSFFVIRFDLLMVNYFLGNGETGVYSIAASAADIMYLIPISIGMILFPQVSKAMKGGWEFTRKVAWGTAGIMAAICILVGLIARPFITFFYGQVFAGAGIALLWLLPGIFTLSVNTIFMNFLAARGMPLIVVISPFIALAANVLLNLTFIPRFGINGAAMTSSIAYMMMLAVSLIYLGARSNVRTE
jgi:O-antigen/teichoic acid export membrane protein